MSKKFDEDGSSDCLESMMFEEENSAAEERAARRKHTERVCRLSLLCGLSIGVISFIYFAKKMFASS